LAFHSGREADYSPPSSTEVKEWVELYLHSPNMPSWRGAQLGGAQGQLYLYLFLFLYHVPRLRNSMTFPPIQSSSGAHSTGEKAAGT
jgi:hypothetical protein